VIVADATTWIAVGSIGTFVLAIATAALVWMTRGLAGQAEASAEAAQEQVRVMRAAADADALAIRDQITAATAQSEATQRAARAQLQPIVFARISGGARRSSTTGTDVVDGPRTMIGADLADGEIGFPYTLANEGTGIALDVHHGVEIAGADYAFGGGMPLHVLHAGEKVPPPTAHDRPKVVVPFYVVVNEADLPTGWRTLVRTYWARFENVFGEQFETRVPSNPQQSASFMLVAAISSL
jgi:hypothetical protein